jgi:lipopolysaccharide cholinephosphotransferase
MRKLFIHILAAFIPSKVKRKAFRNKYIKDSEVLACLDYVKDLLKAHIDIGKIPPARGNLKIIQDSSLSLLSVFDKIAKKHNIIYWIDSGTLIGYVRHNGFIPWDDDIDIAMLRSDYDKTLKILETEFNKDGFYFICGDIIRLYYKDTPAQVDIFPLDSGFSKEPLVGGEYTSFITELNSIKAQIRFDRKKIKKQTPFVPSEDILKALSERDKILLKNKKPTTEGFLFYGVETIVKDRSLFAYSDIFPLAPAEFMGIKTFIPQNWSYYLFLQYGDFMALPPEGFPKHTEIWGRLNKENYKECQELIKRHYPKNVAHEI